MVRSLKSSSMKTKVHDVKKPSLNSFITPFANWSKKFLFAQESFCISLYVPINVKPVGEGGGAVVGHGVGI